MHLLWIKDNTECFSYSTNSSRTGRKGASAIEYHTPERFRLSDELCAEYRISLWRKAYKENLRNRVLLEASIIEK